MRYATTLPGRIAEIVESPRWGGGLHRDHLARMVGCHPWDKTYTSALWVLYGKKRVDFCGRQYVVMPASNPKTNPKGTTP